MPYFTILYISSRCRTLDEMNNIEENGKKSVRSVRSVRLQVSVKVEKAGAESGCVNAINDDMRVEIAEFLDIGASKGRKD